MGGRAPVPCRGDYSRSRPARDYHIVCLLAVCGGYVRRFALGGGILPAPTPEATPEPEAVSRYEAVGLTEEDAYILACLVYHEARGEPFEGQAAVVEVVFNRCLSDEFPDTVEEVVFQKYGDVWQFSPAPYLYTAEPDETQYSAVMYAYNAEEPIVPPETVFFSTSPYNEHVTAIIGNHYFCKIGG